MMTNTYLFDWMQFCVQFNVLLSDNFVEEMSEIVKNKSLKTLAMNLNRNFYF